MNEKQKSHKRTLQQGLLVCAQVVFLLWSAYQHKARIHWSFLSLIVVLCSSVLVVFVMSVYDYWKEYIRGKQA